ncbi:MAG: hypothetical protein N2Z20_03845 [Elusimicrobiales bacterium]|nr:hypothetical protein [Elusimicrobiales bacterium]
MIAEVLFPVALDKTFYYDIPLELQEKIKPGIRIYASFSYRKKVIGYVVSVLDKVEEQNFEFQLKKIDKIIDTEPPFIVEKFLELSSYISERWFSPRGMVLRDFLRYLPVKLDFQEKKYIIIPSRDRKLIISNNIFDELLKFIKEYYLKIPIVIFFPNIFLLKLFKRKIEKIGINDIYTYTSNEKVSYKRKITQLVLNNDFKLILSTKGGIHLPFKQGIMIALAEPLNSLYRQFEQHPYYDTVELLLKISQIYNIGIRFYSSFISPFFKELSIRGDISIENKLDIHKFSYEVSDIKKEYPISSNVLDEVKKLIKNDKKVMFISYSKYSANITFCPSCKSIKKCSNCDSIMRTDIFDEKKVYLCPYCNTKEEYSNFCNKCKITMVSKGYGTQRFYEELINYFPDRKILLVDGRIIHVPKRLDYVINEIEKNSFDIICATEIAASHIINCKFSTIIFIVYESQYSYDYSYAERFFEKLFNISSLLDKDGLLKIYTYNTDNFIFSKISDPLKYFDEEIILRKKFHYPPYAFLYDIEILSKNKELLKEKINELVNLISNENFLMEYDIISFDPSHKINKIRGSDEYLHFSSIKLKNYIKFFKFLDEYIRKYKFKLNIIAR